MPRFQSYTQCVSRPHLHESNLLALGCTLPRQQGSSQAFTPFHVAITRRAPVWVSLPTSRQVANNLSIHASNPGWEWDMVRVGITELGQQFGSLNLTRALEWALISSQQRQ